MQERMRPPPPPKLQRAQIAPQCADRRASGKSTAPQLHEAARRRARGGVERIAREEERFRQSRPARLRAQRSAAAREAAPPAAAEEGARAARRAAGAHPEGAEEVARAALPEDELRRAGLRRVGA